jgi:hypothetical protein
MDNIRSVSIQYLPSPEELDASRSLVAGKFLFPGFTYTFSVAGKQIQGGKFKYFTPFEDVPEDKKEEYTQVKKELEKYFGEGALEPFNESFWKDLQLVINKKTTFLNLQTDPVHKLFYYLIKHGGFPEVAPSYDVAVEKDRPPRWYMIEPEQYADISVADDRIINKAIAALESLDDDKSFDDMFLVHKNLITPDRGITKRTPKSAIYKDLSDFIHGKIVKTDKRRTPKQFVDTVKLITKDKKKLFVTAYVRDSVYFNFISHNQDDQLINTETKTKYGATVDQAIAKLSTPGMQDELDNIMNKVDKKWSE